ncbi:hypothetical protein K488DRAFT_69081 [Vararia minispora EC-137]|uniref:Uncharacterized protein n=1 Tax=Vararia minispora EC-137 TaxID=1314806 RepID=A0ACB8QRP4_9AGAM|nr:hypothetical protein K488DRAFT_69081 [Vararia minispora EC-137]
MSATELQEGTYSIQHCTQRTLAVVAPGGSTVMHISSGISCKDRRGLEVWKIEKAARGYQMSHTATSRYATGRGVGSPVQVSTSEQAHAQIWEITETREKNIFTIQAVDSQCCWTVEGGDIGYSIILREEPHNKARSWWKFVATPVPPAEQTAPPDQLALKKFPLPPHTVSAEIPRFPQTLSGDFALRVVQTSAYMKTTSAGQLYSSSPYLDADAVFTAEEKNGRCALQGAARAAGPLLIICTYVGNNPGSNYMYIVNRIGDAVCDDTGADEDRRLYFDVIPVADDAVCFAAFGYNQTWYLASNNDNRMHFFQPQLGENTHFNVVPVPRSARPFPPTFSGNIAIRCSGDGAPGKLLRVENDGHLAFSGDNYGVDTEFTVYSWIGRLVSRLGRAIGLTITKHIKCEDAGQTPQGFIQILGRPHNKFSIAFSGYPWQNKQTWFVSIDQQGGVVLTEIENETCHFSIEDRGKEFNPAMFREIPLDLMQELKITIRNRNNHYVWASKKGELRDQLALHDDSVIFSVTKSSNGKMHWHVEGPGDEQRYIHSPNGEYVWCKPEGPADQAHHTHFHILQVERSSGEIVLAFGTGRDRFLSTHRGEKAPEGSFAITNTLDDDCYLRLDICGKDQVQFVPFRPNGDSSGLTNSH